MPEPPVTEHRLEGLEPDNLLAFLALLGLLRALETARPTWRPRARWSLERHPLRPVLALRAAVDAGAVAEAAAEGVAMLAQAHAFDRKLLTFTPEEARRKLLESRDDAGKAALWAALLSDAAVDPLKGLVRKTPLNFLDVAQVAFLKTLGMACSKSQTPKRGMARAIEDACFATWRRRDASLSFRLDPIEDSRYAYRANAPADDKQMVEHGANVLATLGLRSMTLVPFQRSSSVQLAMMGMTTQDGVVITWPIWSPLISLTAIEALLATPGEAREAGSTEIAFFMAARRLNAPGSKYRNISPARNIEDDAALS